MIYLGYIQGYNSFNEFRFNGALDRDTYLKNNASTIIDTYYPPYFTNVIKLSSTELDIENPINYVIIEFNNKCYYYFISDNIYINEDCYEIPIEMDTILTFMFDVKINNGILRRKSIKRWNDFDINRNYCRENLSEGFFDNYSFNEIDCYTCLIMTSTSDFNQNLYKSYFRINDIRIDIGCYSLMYVALPANYNNATMDALTNIHFTDDNNNEIAVMYYRDYARNIFPMFTTDFINDVRICRIPKANKDIIKEVVYSISNNVINDIYIRVNGLGDYNTQSVNRLIKYNNDYVGAFNTSGIINNTAYIKQMPFNFSKNKHTEVLFDKSFVPQIIDENYINIEFGSYNSTSKYPIHLLKTQYYQNNIKIDYSHGNLNYLISPANDISNKYNCNVTNEASTMDIYNNAWKQYEALNKGTLSKGIQLNVANSIWKNVSAIAGNQYSYSANKTLSELSNKEFTQEMFAVKARHGEVSNYVQLGNFAMDMANIKANYEITKENLENAPDTTINRGYALNVELTNYNKIFEKIDVVNDIDTVAKRLEYYGYRVNEAIVGDYFITNISNIRYYYNVIQLDTETYTLLYNTPKTLIDNFVYRLKNGIRLFNFASMTIEASLRYDNVETEFIEPEEVE